jgi:S-methylmethionine-dependent homocysteine/selenocysteine methylase
MASLQERLDRGDVLLIDGGMGTELERRGVEMDGEAWAGTAMKTRPDIISQIHREFVEAGADIIIANTYAASPHVLKHAGYDAVQTRELNLLGCRLAREAADEAGGGRQVFVAGSMSSFRAGLDVAKLPDEAEARGSYRWQAEALAAGGVDFILLEMMLDPVITPIAVGAAVATGLPVWVGFSARVADGKVLGFHRYADDPFDTVLDSGLRFPIQAAGIMHTNVEFTPPALAALKAKWKGPMFAYPHSGEFKMPHWQFDTVMKPEPFVAEAMGYIGSGVQAIGGCCGIGPDHIARLRQKLPARMPGR